MTDIIAPIKPEKSTLPQLDIEQYLATLTNLINIDFGKTRNDRYRIQEEYEKKLLAMLEHFLANTNRNLYDLLLLSISSTFWPSIDIILFKAKNGRVTKTLEKAIYRVPHAILKNWDRKIQLLTKYLGKKEMLSSLTLEQCLELAKKYDLSLDKKCRYWDFTIKQKIILTHFDLDWRIVQSRKQRGSTLNSEQAAKLFSKKQGKDITPANVLELAVEHNLGVYINRGFLNLDKNDFLNSLMTIQTPPISEIQNDLEKGIISKEYPYAFDGLIRLLNKHIQNPYDQFASKQTVKDLRDGTIIRINSPWIFSYQLSLSEFILGQRNFYQVNYSQDGLQITVADILYREEELSPFLVSSQQILSEKASIPLDSEVIKLYEFGKKQMESIQEGSRKAKEKRDIKTRETWRPILILASQKAKDKPNFFTAVNLAGILQKEFPSLKTNTIRRKISKSPEIKPFLKHRKKKIS